MIENCTAVILAGGESKRMGQDKAQVMLAGATLLQRAVDILTPLFADVVMSVREPIADCGLPQYCDVGDGHGPLIGVSTALQQVKTDWVFVMAVDMPFVSRDLIVALADKRGGRGRQAVVPFVNGYLQPLLAYYAQSCLPVMQQKRADGERSLRRVIECLDRIIVKECDLKVLDEKVISFLDLDSQKELKYARKRLEK